MAALGLRDEDHDEVAAAREGAAARAARAVRALGAGAVAAAEAAVERGRAVPALFDALDLRGRVGGIEVRGRFQWERAPTSSAPCGERRARGEGRGRGGGRRKGERESGREGERWRAGAPQRA